MARKNFFLFCVFIFIQNVIGISQNIKVNDSASHVSFVNELKNSKETKYQDILALYDTYIADNPNDIKVQISKCKFVGTAYYDDYEDYDPNWEETDVCIEQLFEEYPDKPTVILYKLENLWGEEKTALIDSIFERFSYDFDIWPDTERQQFYGIAARGYAENQPTRALDLAKKAQNDNEDLSILMAEIYINQGKNDEARNILKENIDREAPTWELNNKGNLLIDLDDFDGALELFNRVKEIDTTAVNNANLYQLFLSNEKYEIAREYLVADTVNAWMKAAKVQNLLTHDIKYSKADVALETYIHMQEESYYDDFFGIKRIKIFLKAPFNNFSTVGFSHFFWLALLIILTFLLPYLWVLPVFGLSRYFDWKFEAPTFWNLKHFWLISFGYLMIQVLLSLLYYYTDSMNYLFDVVTVYGEEEALMNTEEIIFFSVGLLITTLFFLNKERLRYVFKSNWSLGKIIILSIAFFVFNLIFLNVLSKFIDITEAVSYLVPLNIKEEIAALIQENGFWAAVGIVAILAPFYEEIIFRGIILNSVQKHLGFKAANIIQACLFGLIHFFMPLFPFYLLFGIVTGIVVKKSGGLISGIIFHAFNNFMVVVVLYYSLKNAGTFITQ